MAPSDWGPPSGPTCSVPAPTCVVRGAGERHGMPRARPRGKGTKRPTAALSITHGGTHQRLLGRKAEVRVDRAPDPPLDLRGRRDMPGGGGDAPCMQIHKKKQAQPQAQQQPQHSRGSSSSRRRRSSSSSSRCRRSSSSQSSSRTSRRSRRSRSSRGSSRRRNRSSICRRRRSSRSSHSSRSSRGYLARYVSSPGDFHGLHGNSGNRSVTRPCGVCGVWWRL
jgi:hypothetical protein